MLTIPSKTIVRPLTFCLAVLSFGACGGDGPTNPPSTPFTVAGSIKNNTGQPIPAGARLIAVWSVASGSPDYSYIFGEGSVDRTTNRFTITFDKQLPREALNSTGNGVGLGVGVLILTTDPTLCEGRLPADFKPELTVIGAAGQYGLIYLDRDPAPDLVDWAERFPRGYAAGRGIDLPGVFDGFEPIASSAVELVVDKLENITFVNWT